MKRSKWLTRTRPTIESDLTARQSLFMCLVIVGLVLFACVSITVGLSSGDTPVDAWSAWQIMARGLHDTLPWSLPTLATAAIALPPASQYLLNQADRASVATRDLQWIGRAGIGIAILMFFLTIGAVVDAALDPLHIPHALVVTVFAMGVITVGVKIGTLAVPPASLRLELHKAAYEAAEQRKERLRAPGPLPLKRWQALLVAVAATTILSMPALLVAGMVSSPTIWGITMGAALAASLWHLYVLGEDVGKRGVWTIAQRIFFHVAWWVCVVVIFLLLALDLGSASLPALLPLVVAVSIPAVSGGLWFRRRRGPVAHWTIRAAAERHAMAATQAELQRVGIIIEQLRRADRPSFRRRVMARIAGRRR